MEPEKQTPFFDSIRIYKDLNLTNQVTKCSAIPMKSSTLQYDLEQFINSSSDLSFEIQMHRENIQGIKEAATKYLEQCLVGGYSRKLGFKDIDLYLYKQRILEEKQANGLDALITQNRLLKDWMKKQICLILKQQESLAAFLKQIPETFGLTVTKELAFIIYQILKAKYQKYNQIFKNCSSILPKFNCYEFLDDQYRFLAVQASVFDQINLEEVTNFADKDMEKIGKSLYFTDSEIKILNLKQITAETNPKANLIEEFITLLRQISRSVFLSLAGGTQPLHSHGSLFDIPRQISFTDISEVDFLTNKSLSRVPPQLNEDQKYEAISKKIKLQ